MKVEELYQKYLQSTGVSTDSRNIKAGNIYFALKGGNFNGNEFAKQAIDDGAMLAVVDEGKNGGANYVLVNDVLSTLQALAKYHRKQFNIPIIGITGTNGKTTTKELIHAVLSKKYKTHATAGNLNNHIGVPLTLLSMPKDTEIAIIEMGANKPGDIKELCDIADPEYGIITNIGKAHLEGFGSFEGVARTKSELYLHILKNEGKAFVNGSSEHLVRMAQRLKKPMVYLSKSGYFNIKYLESSPYLIYETESGNQVESHLIGKYNFENIAAALCIGKYFEVPEDAANQAIVDYIPSNNRSQVLKKGERTIILDAYNANPTSMAAAIDNFQQMAGENKLMILGDMFELGAERIKEHQHIVQKCLASGISTMFCGKSFYGQKVDNAGFFETIEDLMTNLKSKTDRATQVLVKGSRGIGLEKIVDYL